jgi:DNA (cytosine-5)-methyltransferase 1
MSRPWLLDAFCGAGGATRGYQQAGFRVFGVDKAPQPNYVGDDFHQGDALEFMAEHGRKFAARHASPPCQAYSVLRRANPGAIYPDLVAPTRALLIASGVPWVMENVPGAPLRATIVLCGSMFGLGANGRQLRRHRLFETGFMMLQPECEHIGEAIGVYGGGPVGRYTFENGVRKGLKGRRGGYQGTMAERREAMGIDWMPSRELNQAIPPAYSRFIGERLLEHMRAAA